MQFPRRPRPRILAAALAAAGLALAIANPTVAVPRDGQHDFDFNVGVWRTHITRILNPFAGGDQSMQLNGTVTVRKVWDGRGQLEEIEADGPNGHWEGLTLFLYNPAAGQWTQTYADASNGVLTTSTVGEFNDGRGELYATETVNGRQVLIRGVWSHIAPDSHTFDEAYSTDGGRTWLPVFIAELIDRVRLEPRTMRRLRLLRRIRRRGRRLIGLAIDGVGSVWPIGSPMDDANLTKRTNHEHTTAYLTLR